MIATVAVAAETVSDLFTRKPVEVAVTWKYDPANPRGAGVWTIEPNEVTIDKKVAIITYTFTPDSTPGVRFAKGPDANEPFPVLWISPSNPDNFEVTLLSDESLLIADANETRGIDPQSFSFLLVAVYQDVTRISPDPTIINKEPS